MSSKEKFNTKERPHKVNGFWQFIELVASTAMLLPVKGKINKVNCEGLKPPYIVLSNHGSMVDFAVAAKAVFPNKTGWVASIEEFNGREWLFRQIGVIYKRKFTGDITVVKHILHALTKDKTSVVIYPEARFSLIGATERIDGALGKLAKVAKCPVVILTMTGNFLRSPQWNKHPYRKVPVSAEFKQVVTREEAQNLSADEIQKRIDDNFHYDDYAWQKQNHIKIDSPERATNIHRVLYRCPHCEKEFTTYSKGTKIWCEDCGTVWDMDEYGTLKAENAETRFSSSVEWYNWEREKVREEVRSGNYKFEDTARLEWLECSKKGFKPLGEVKLTQDYNGFTMTGTIDGKPFEFNRPAPSMSSCHIEYDYKGRGDAIDLCTLEDTYFVFPLTAKNCLTKLHFATEELYDYMTEKKD